MGDQNFRSKEFISVKSLCLKIGVTCVYSLWIIISGHIRV